MAAVLKARTIEAIKPSAKRQEIADGAIPGLYLVVQPSGIKSWAVRYRFNSKSKKLTLGRVARIDLKTARELARSVLIEVEKGIDPADKKIKENRAKAEGQYLVESTLDDFVKLHIRRKNKATTALENIRLIEKEIKPAWQGMDIRKVNRRDIMRILDDKVADGSPYLANRLHSLLRKFLGWCFEREILDHSPFGNIPVPAIETSRDRVLTESEIKAFWEACESLGYPFGLFAQILLLTAQRRNEVAGMRWDELDLDKGVWNIPAIRAKNGIGHTVQLSIHAIEIIQSAPVVSSSEYVFSTNGISKISGFSKAKVAIDAEMKSILGDGYDSWRYHDLRRTAASGMAALGVPQHVVEKILNHKTGIISGVAAVYNRHDYAGERASALSAWANFVFGSRDNVIVLSRTK